jgi:predicted ester cyclase
MEVVRMADIATQYRKYLEAFNAQDHDTIDTLVADQLDFRISGGVKVTTRGELRAENERWLKAFPDGKARVDELIVSGNTVFARGSSSGTHNGPLPTTVGYEVPPTGRKVTEAWLEIARYEGDLYTGGELIYDRMGIAEQLGLMPTAATT